MNDEVCRQLDDYLLGELPDEQRAGFEQHLCECETCRSIAKQQAIVDDHIRSASRSIPVPAGLSNRAKQHIESNRRRRVILAAFGLASAAGLLFSIWYFNGNAVQPADPSVPQMITRRRRRGWEASRNLVELSLLRVALMPTT